MPAEIKIKLPKPFPAQQKILNMASRFNAVCMGEQGGKTTLGIEVLIASKRGAFSSKAPVAWFSPDKARLDEVRRRVKAAIDPAIKRQANARRLELVNGNAVDFYALDDMPKALPAYGLIVVDDVRHHPEFLSRFEDLLFEALREHQGSAWFLSDAFGKKNDFYRLWQRGRADPDWSCWQFDSFVNPHLPPEAKAAAEACTGPEYEQRFGAQFLDVALDLSAEQRILKPGETFVEWCDRLESEGLKVDCIPFTLSDRPAMRFIYGLIPSTTEDAFDRIDVIMKCTQVGFTVMEMLAMIYLALRFSPAKIGMFMPGQTAATEKSSIRFMPVVRTIPAVHQLMTDDSNGGRGGEGNVMVRAMGQSRFYFRWTTGKVSTESNPMDVVSFDEVQEMDLPAMEKTRERMSASKLRYTLMGSTANWPDKDIHWWYKKGTQHQFHTMCPSCGTGQVLDDHFPNCIGYDPEAPRLNAREREAGMKGEYRYKCHACGGWIDEPQRGEWVARVPEATIRSVHFPQFLSPTISPRAIIEAYREADDMKNFFNRKLGKPYTDPSQVPVNLEMLNACAEEGMRLGLEWKRNARGTFMGLDQMGSFIVAVIKERRQDGRQAMIHLEYIFRAPTKEDPEASPWQRCDELMAAYGVQCCVVETLPNYDSAKSFARRHDGKVFLAGYGNMEGDMLAWGDAPKLSISERRTDEELRDRYTVRLDQYKCMQVSMSRFASKMCLFPDPDGLVQDVLDKGAWRKSAVCKEFAFFHFTRTALVVLEDEEEKKFKRKVVKVGIDPHTSYANMLCDVAWSRAHGTSTFFLPDAGSPKRAPLEPEAINSHEVVVNIVREAQEAAMTGDVCGKCISRDSGTGMCSEIGMLTGAEDPGCWAFVGAG